MTLPFDAAREYDACQERGYLPLKFRSAIVPAVSIGSHLGWILILAGILLWMANVTWLGVLAFSGRALFALVTLLVEFNASRRAQRLLTDNRLIVTPDEERGARSALNAPATPAGSGQLGKVSIPGGSYTNVSATQLHMMLDKKDFALVNVHIPYEGEIAKTDAFIPYNEIEKSLDKLPADKNARIVLYCRSGRMSTLAAETLVRLGYTNVSNMEGGMVAWETLGFPLQKK